MTLSTTTNKQQANGDGVAVNFPFPNLFFTDSDLVVTSTVITTGVDTLQVIVTDYTVTGAGNPAGGTVIFLVAPLSTVRITIRRVVPLTQGSDYINASSFDQEVLERDLDENVMMAQQTEEEIARSIRLPASTTLATQNLPEPEANKLLGWNTAADGLENKSQTDGTVTIPTNAADAKKVLQLDAAGTAVEVGTKLPVIGAGDAEKVIKVNATEDGLAVGSIFLQPSVLADAAKTFVVGDMNNIFVITPTATRILTLPTTGVAAGDTIDINNLASAQDVTVEASGGTDIVTYADHRVRFTALQGTPTTDAHWRVEPVTGEYSAASKEIIAVTTIEIGDWDMVATVALNVNHNLTLVNIRYCMVLIRNDLLNSFYSIDTNSPTGTNPEGVWVLGATQVAMQRLTGGFFDGASFDSTSFNRGYITLHHAKRA